MRSLLLLELNEINFDFLTAYAERGELPSFARFLDRHGYTETTSEQAYAELEPWIQWVTAHTGKSFADHGVFRLGDIVGSGLDQIWERLERKGYRVGAMSPMNAECRVRQPAFFVPDPWTPTQVKANPALQRLHAAIAQSVNDNAEARISPRSAYELATTTLATMRPRTAGTYAKLLLDSKRKPWVRAMFLDLLLADLFTQKVAQTRPDFASLFLNAGAHIQHHYLFSSSCYTGELRNPQWYVGSDEDPVLDVYRLYDDILARIIDRFPDARIMLATGLHQDPYPKILYYWRLKNHSSFLRRIGAVFQSVEPRMSRDFLVRCRDESEAAALALRLERSTACDGRPLFTVDNRGNDLFVEFVYPDDIAEDAAFIVGNERHEGLRAEVTFIAIKNGEHNGIGYFADSEERLSMADRFPLAALPARIEAAMETLGRMPLAS